MIERFKKFHVENPRVWKLFKRFALEAIGAGQKKLSASLITERIRWEIAITTRGEPFKINNNFRAYYARLFHRTFREHGQVFSIRQSEADDYIF